MKRTTISNVDIYNKFYEMLYNGIIEEDTILRVDVEECIEMYRHDFNALCRDLHDCLISDREQAAFFLTMNFLNS